MGRPKTQKDQLAMLPYDGPRWYSRQATIWRMQKGCAWDDIKLVFTSSAHLPPDFFVTPIATIEATSGKLAKQATNGLLGLWGIDSHYSWVVSTQSDEYFELPHKDKVLTRKAPGGVDKCYRQQLLQCSSMRPIVQQVLDREKLLLAELRDALYKLCLLYTSDAADE